MAILAFQKPDKVLCWKRTTSSESLNFVHLSRDMVLPSVMLYAEFYFHLSKVLLSHLSKLMVWSMSLLRFPGVIEDVTNIILCLKQVRFKQIVEEMEAEKVSMTVSGTEIFTAGDIGKQLSGFEVLNPDLVLCHLDKSASFTIELTINKGRGYVSADENRANMTTDDVNVLAIDSIYTPIRNVKYALKIIVLNKRPTMKNCFLKLLLMDLFIERGIERGG